MTPEGWGDRVRDLMWFLAHLGDVRSDMSAFHRVDDLDTLDAARFTSLVTRLPLYDGATRNAALRDHQERAEQPPPAPATREPAASGPAAVKAHSAAHFAALNQTREYGPLGVNQAGVFDLG